MNGVASHDHTSGRVPSTGAAGTVSTVTIETPLGAVSSADVFTREDYEASRELVRQAAEAYYLDGTSTLDDVTYDGLARRVIATEIVHPEWVDDRGPIAQVGAGTSGGDVAHSAAMLSLDNVFSSDELIAFMERVERLVGHPVAAWRVEPKLDGLALAARYVNGRLTSLVTRGDGRTGEDVTHAIDQIAGLPRSLNEPVSVEIRGEVMMTDADFATANEIRLAHGEPPLANPRNGAAGTLRAQNRDYVLPLSFFAYTLLEDGAEVRDQSDAMSFVTRLGVATASQSSSQTTHAGVVDAVAGFLAQRATIGIAIDGAVIKIDDLATRREAGSTSRAPRWAIAYKYPADTRSTTLLDIEVGVGRTGNLSFTAVLAPVEVGGVIVSAASVHNPSVITTKGLRVSDPTAPAPQHQLVWVRRAGDVIPEITGPANQDTAGTVPYVAPSSCPRCGGPLDTTGLIWRCQQGRSCATGAVIEYAVSRDCLDIEGLGDTIVAGLVANGAIAKVTDLFELTEAKLLTVDRLGPKVATKILAHVELAKRLPMNRVFCALGVTMTGRSMSRRLAGAFRTMDALRHATIEQLQAVDGVGPERAGTIHAELRLLSDELDYLAQHGIGQSEPTTASAPTQGVLAGQTWVVTGTMVGALAGRSRNEVHELLEQLGAKVSGSVSKTTTVLLVGEKAGSKAQKAAELGVTVMNESQFADAHLGE